MLCRELAYRYTGSTGEKSDQLVQLSRDQLTKAGGEVYRLMINSQQYQIRSVEQLDALINGMRVGGGNALVAPDLLAPEISKLNELYNEGTPRMQQGQPQHAIPFFKEALRLAPNFVAARSNLGFSLARTGDGKQALLELRSALAYAPNDPEVWVNIAAVCQLMGDIPTAEEANRRVLAINPRYYSAILNLGSILIATKRLDEAETVLQSGLNIINENCEWGPRITPGYNPHVWDGELLNTHYHLSRIDSAKHNWSEALAHLEKCVAIDPSDADVQALLPEAKRRARRWLW